ncbi:MAG: PQQ-dependent sugar dehydrogenase [Pseudomonadota bacterium]
MQSMFESIRTIMGRVAIGFIVTLCAACGFTQSAAAEISLRPGFQAQVFAEGVGSARHIVVNENGDVYVALRRQTNGSGIVALRDTTGDGEADVIKYFGDLRGTGIDIFDGYLYFGADDRVVRFKLTPGELVPKSKAEVIVGGFPRQRQHAAKSIAFDGKGGLYVNVGAPSNACQEKARTRRSPGLAPCPQLERQAAIWKFNARIPGQSQADGTRYAHGIRNAVALDWNPVDDALYFAQHGRDQLGYLFGTLYNDEQNAALPGEEIHKARPGKSHGWPYSYYDPIQSARMLAPEYGGDGKLVLTSGTTVNDGVENDHASPVTALPGHWAPNDMLFYQGRQFPAEYSRGAFVAFHGSWNRAPLPQRGYNVTFVPMVDGRSLAEPFVFADGFKGADPLASPRDAKYRPMGLAQTPDGALMIADSVQGRIWRITYAAE